MTQDGSAWGSLISGTVLLLLAGVAFYLFFFPVLTDVHRASSWDAVPCQILSSRVVTHRGASRGTSRTGTTYSIDIQYRYELGGRTYTGNRYGFMDGGSDSSVKGKRAIVSSYKPGTTAECYVDPEDRSSAVLFRGYPRMLWFGLLPLLVAVVGIRAIVSAAGRVLRPPTPSDP
jgi:hypothetical protein